MRHRPAACTAARVALVREQPTDQHCQTEAGGDTGYRALVSRTSQPASMWIDPDTVYIRPDDVVVGTGVQLASGANLKSGIWQTFDGAYISLDGVATGAQLPTQLAGAWSCNDFGSTSATDFTWVGLFPDADRFWENGSGSCSVPYRLYCIQQ